jgi:AAA+ ATPase superfamily predicted ATPase
MNLTEFDLSELSENPNIIIYGAQSSGKTTLINKIIDIQNMRNKFTIFDFKQGEYKDACSEYKTYNEEIFQPIVYSDSETDSESKYIIKKKKKVDIIDEICKNQIQLLNKNENNISNHWIILDDIIIDIQQIETKVFKTLFTNGKCMKLGLFITFQYPINIPIIYRNYIDYVFIFKDSLSTNAFKNIWKMYFQMIEKYDDFIQILENVSTCLVLHKLNQIDYILFNYMTG